MADTIEGTSSSVVTSPGERSIVSQLLILSFLTVLPLLLLAGALSFYYANAERRVIEAERADVTRNPADIVDRDILSIVSGLQVLAASPDLTDNLPRFHAHASTLTRGSQEAIVLLDRSGQQIISTRYPLGAALPRRANMHPFAEVFETGARLVSGLETSTAISQPIIFVSVPVYREGAIAYALSRSVALQRLSGILSEAGLKPGWIGGIVDRKGLFVARSLNAEEFVGHPARPELVSVAQSTALEG